MKVAIFSARDYEKLFLKTANNSQHQLSFFHETLSEKTIHLAHHYEAVCCFVTDKIDEAILTQLKKIGVKLIALRSAGYDNVDMTCAKKLNISVVRVPSYSPASIAEFTIALLLALRRKLLNAHDNIRRYNFSLENMVGFNLNKKTVGIIGTGKIGSYVAKLLIAFGCEVLAYDIFPNDFCKSLGVQYVDIDTLYQRSDIITLHCPLTTETKFLINSATLKKIKSGAIIINTARGGLIDTNALIQALKEQHIAAVGLDVYEHEAGLFFNDHSHEIILDDCFVRLQAFSNVLITGHQAFLTQEALTNIANTTINNLTAFEAGKIQNEIV